MEREPEILEPPKRYSLLNPAQSVKVKVQIMQRVKGRRVHFAGQKKVPEVRTRERPARVAAAAGIGRQLIVGIARVLDIQTPVAREELAVAGVPGRQDAIEQIDTPRH
jgi:hypothetical protein